MPKLEEWEIKKYWEIFNGLNPINKKLSGDKVSVVFKNSRLDQSKLTKIWDLSDIDVDGELDFEEFCIAMRLIFDLVNGSSTSLPDSLPGWLIPGSKQHLIQADRAVLSNSTGFDYDTEDEELSLSSDFDWYISPTDKSTYETIYSNSCDKYGRINFNSLNDLYKTLNDNVPETDISSAWNLVNPKQYETIDKDQCLVFLHILNQRSNGKRVPRSVPASLRATFSKEKPDYNVDSHQGDLQNNSGSSQNNSSQNNNSSTKHSFAEGYLNKLGTSSSSTTLTKNNGTDFSLTKGTDWEEVKLRRELEDLEKLIVKAENEKNNKGKDDSSSLIKYEFEQLLKYKNLQLEELNRVGDLKGVSSNIESVQSQVNQLSLFYDSKKTELQNLKAEIAAMK